MDEVTNAVARVYEWEQSAPPAVEKLAFTDSEIKNIEGRYAYSFDQTVSVYAEGDKVFTQYLGSKPEELLKIAENTYIRRTKKAKIQFLKNPENDEWSLVFLPEKEGEQLDYKNRKLSILEKLGTEWLLEGNVEEALAIYQRKKAESPEFRPTHEQYINNFGYQMMGEGSIDYAINIFRLNVALHPKAFNTYDSLGEAYMKKGEKELAIKNYKKSLELNPKNENAVAMLKELE